MAGQRLEARIDHTARYMRDRFAFLTECCYTRDEVAQEDQRVKLIPPKAYLSALVEAWERYPRLLIPKSRRMIITWSLLALDLSVVLFSEQVRVFVVADDLEKSATLLERVEFMFNHLPAATFPLKPKPHVVHGVKGLPVTITFPALGSSIQALSQNPEDLRGEGATLIHVEEFHIWQWPEESWRAMLPTIMGGGRIVVVGNARGGTFFERIIKDELNRTVGNREGG